MENKKKKVLIIAGVVIGFLIILDILLIIFTNKNGDSAYITLRTRANEIYEWKYDIENKNIIKFVEKKRFGDIDGKTNGNITEKYYFKALKPGKTKLNFTFTNTKNGSYLDKKYYIVKVDKIKNISIEEINQKS